MSLNTKNLKNPGRGGSTNKQEPMEPGTYPCRVAQMIDLGLQPQRPYQGKEKAPKHMVMITYEFVDEFCLDEKGEEMEDKPRWLSERISINPLSSELAKSTKRYNSIDPEGEADGDFAKLLGMPCNVTVVQRESGGKVYDNIGDVTSVRKRDVARMPELQNEPRSFDLDSPDMEVFGSLPEWIQEIIKSNLEFQGSALAAALNGGVAPAPAEEDDDVPFEDDDGDEW